MSEQFSDEYNLGLRAGLELALATLAETATGRADGWQAHDEATTLLKRDLKKVPQAPRPISVGPLPKEVTE